MRLTYTVAVVALLGCGGGDFRSDGAPGPDGGPGVGSGGAGGAASSAEVGSSSTGEGPGGAGATGAGGDAQSSASTGGTGGGGESASSSSTGVGAGGDGGGGGAPCVPKTCAGEDVYCGALDDGCGTVLDCGGYDASSLCTFPSAYSCACPSDHGHAFWCGDQAPDVGNSQPPAKGDCVVQANYPNLWCCELQ